MTNGAQSIAEAGVNDEDGVQDYILLVLSDSNLPTGGFVASSGLEAVWAHGLLPWLEQSSNPSDQLVAFLHASVDTYAHTVAGYLLDVHRLTLDYMRAADDDDKAMDKTLGQIQALDQTLHSMTLNHVTQRASTAQGVALLTLYAKSFSPLTPASMTEEQRRVSALLRGMKRFIRLGMLHGHLAVCWAAFMAAVGIVNPMRALSTHLFLQARSILSAAVRLNIVGPYQMHRLLANDVKQIIDDAVRRTSQYTLVLRDEVNDQRTTSEGDFDWNWHDVGPWQKSYSVAPKSTWPLGDLLQARHDQLHSRLFNS